MAFLAQYLLWSAQALSNIYWACQHLIIAMWKIICQYDIYDHIEELDQIVPKQTLVSESTHSPHSGTHFQK